MGTLRRDPEPRSLPCHLIKCRVRASRLDPSFLTSVTSPTRGRNPQTQCPAQPPSGASIPVSQVGNLSSEPESACQGLQLVGGGGGIGTRSPGSKTNKHPATRRACLRRSAFQLMFTGSSPGTRHGSACFIRDNSLHRPKNRVREGLLLSHLTS